VPNVDIPAYLAFLPAALLAVLDAEAEPVASVPGLRVAPGLQRDFPTLENPVVLGLVCDVYRAVRADLRAVLARRGADRAFVDAVTTACAAENAGRSVRDPAYATVIGARDAEGRVVVGPLGGMPVDTPAVEVPPFLRGSQVTLFGPPDSARLAINAMNALHRRRPDEPALVAELVEASGQVPRWGADSEDSKTPRMRDLLQASENLAACFDGSLRYTDPRTGRAYALASTARALPIKRVAGLALPDGHHLLDGSPLPLHLVELVQHVWLHRDRPEALVFYLPKLENEEEAAYVATLLRATEAAVAARHPAYVPGHVRVLVVFENPRAIFRIREMAAALAPYFLGGSLGWHDFLASTARLFRNDPGYRIPVKADPDIVIRNIRESHHILVRDLGPMGALKLGGMYGVLFQDDDPASYAVSMVGFVRDVVTQMKRGLDGYWVAHPDFVRVGIALVEAWRRGERTPGDDTLVRLVSALVPDPAEQAPLLAFVRGPDVPGLAQDDPRYLRAVLAAERGGSSVIANDDPAEVRYNVFQAVQYLADWLCGNGCVALPATMRTARGETVFVRIMDDLATTERSRWELWAEVRHGRVPLARFDTILAEELAFLEAGVDTPTRRIQVRWTGDAARWYPVAARILRALVADPEPPEFVTELLLPFTFDPVRRAADPWGMVQALRATGAA
jgi:malate synthase